MNNNQNGISPEQTKKNLWFFPLGTLGRDMMYNLFTNFILLYVLFTHQLTAAQLMAITVIMIVARVFDAFNDPIMGNIIERTRTRWGKFKPWMLIGILTTSIVIYLAFNVKLQGWSFVIFFAIIYLCYSITYTMHDISYWGIVPSLGKDSSLRDKFTSRTNLCAGIGGALASMLIPIFTTGTNAIGGNAQTAYGVVALIIAVLGPALMCFTIFGVKEDRSYMNNPAPKVSFKKIINTIKNNDQLLWITIIFLIQQIGNGLIAGGIGSTYVYFAFGYEGGLYTIFNTVGLLATAVLMITYPTIAKKTKRKSLMKTMLIVSLIGYALMLLVGLILPNTMVKFWIITIMSMAANLGNYCYYLVMMISILNTVEYNEYLHGERDDGIIASVRPFMTKLGSAFVVLITTLSYLACGVTKYTNQISDIEQQANLGQITEEIKMSQISDVIGNVSTLQTSGLLIVMTVIPAVLMIVCYVLYMKKYKLDEDEYDRIVGELAKR